MAHIGRKSVAFQAGESYQASMENFQSLLNEELSKRIQRNSNYSLRAFARNLEVSHSALSAMLSGKRPITRKTIHKVGVRLGLPDDLLNQYLQPTKASATRGRKNLENYRILSKDQISVLKSWFILPILSLSKTAGFRPDPQYISRRLQISVFEVRSALETLQRTGLLKIADDGTWEDLSGGFTTSVSPEEVSIVKRNLMEQIFHRATEAISTVANRYRDHTGMTIAICKSDLPKARKLISKFRRELAATLEAGEKKDEVYHVAIGLFPMTKININESKGRRNL